TSHVRSRAPLRCLLPQSSAVLSGTIELRPLLRSRPHDFVLLVHTSVHLAQAAGSRRFVVSQEHRPARTSAVGEVASTTRQISSARSRGTSRRRTTTRARARGAITAVDFLGGRRMRECHELAVL